MEIAIRELAPEEFPLVDRLWEQYRGQRTDRGIDRVMGAFADGRLVGTARVRNHPDGLEVDGVFVSDACRGRGLARRLLLDVFILLRADGVHRIEAHPGVARLAGDLLRTAGFVDRDAGSGSYVHPDMVREL